MERTKYIMKRRINQAHLYTIFSPEDVALNFVSAAAMSSPVHSSPTKSSVRPANLEASTSASAPAAPTSSSATHCCFTSRFTRPEMLTTENWLSLAHTSRNETGRRIVNEMPDFFTFSSMRCLDRW